MGRKEAISQAREGENLRLMARYNQDEYIEDNIFKILNDAAQYFEKATEADSTYAWAWAHWGATLSYLGGIQKRLNPSKSEFYNEIGEGLPFHQGVTNFGARFPTDKTYCSVLNRIAEAGDILFSVRAPVGRINIATKKIIIGRGLCAIRSKLENQAFLFQQLKEKFQEEDSIGGGTIFKSVTKEDMHGIKIIVPPSLLMDKFEGIIQPVFQSIEVLTTKNANLRQTRDLLLPKLISGEIDVENLDIETGVINESEVVSDSSQEAIAG